MYMLNLLFDLSKLDGVFSGDQGGAALMKSRNWLKLRPDQPTLPGSNPEVANWDDLGESKAVLLIPNPVGHEIGVRIAPVPNMNPALDPNATLELVVAFGAPVRARQPNASPFEDPPGSGQVVTTIPKPAVVRNSPTLAAGVAWYHKLGTIAHDSGHANKANSYEFALGVIVKSGPITRHYGIDPEMDVSL